MRRNRRGHPINAGLTLRANVFLSRLLGADDIWFGDHAKSMFPSAAWRPDLSPLARFVPSLDAYLDPTVTIAPRGDHPAALSISSNAHCMQSA